MGKITGYIWEDANCFISYQNIYGSNSVSCATSNLSNIADISDEIIRGFKSVYSKANGKDVRLVYILLQKVDMKIREEWLQFEDNFPFL